MVLRNTFIVNELIKLGMKLKKRLTQIVMSNRDIRKIHRMAQSRTYCFGQCFLGGKTGSYFGVVPRKLVNGRLAFPAVQVSK